MKVNFYFDDIAAIKSECVTLCDRDKEEIVRLLNRKVIDMEVFPRKGDNVCFVLGLYSLRLDIDSSYINYVAPDIQRIDEKYRGVNYDVYIDTVYVEDVYMDKN